MSKTRDKHDLTIESTFAEEGMALESLLLAECLFARIISRSLAGPKASERCGLDQQQGS